VKGAAPALPASARRREDTATVGMMIFLGAAAMLFAALFFAYAVMRAQAPAWPPAGQSGVPRGTLALNTLILVAASVALRSARRAGRAGRAGEAPARTWAWAALVLGAAFLGAQALVWRSLVGAGEGPASGIYGSVFFAISGFHAVHVVGGLVALAAVALARGWRDGAGAPAADDGFVRRLGMLVLYWDFVLAVWVLFYVGACLR
jgi:cytochrome c oxidase subunit 3